MENASNNVANGAGASPPQRRRREDLRILVGPFHYDIAKDDRISTLPDEVMQDISDASLSEKPPVLLLCPVAGT